MIQLRSKHDKYAGFTFLQALIAQLKQRSPRVSSFYLFSDGAASQFKQRFILSSLNPIKQSNGLNHLEWNFLATSHGKGAVNGVGGSLMRQSTLSEGISKNSTTTNLTSLSAATTSSFPSNKVISTSSSFDMNLTRSYKTKVSGTSMEYSSSLDALKLITNGSYAFVSSLSTSPSNLALSISKKFSLETHSSHLTTLAVNATDDMLIKPTTRTNKSTSDAKTSHETSSFNLTTENTSYISDKTLINTHGLSHNTAVDLLRPQAVKDSGTILLTSTPSDTIHLEKTFVPIINSTTNQSLPASTYHLNPSISEKPFTDIHSSHMTTLTMKAKEDMQTKPTTGDNQSTSDAKLSHETSSLSLTTDNISYISDKAVINANATPAKTPVELVHSPTVKDSETISLTGTHKSSSLLIAETTSMHLAPITFTARATTIEPILPNAMTSHDTRSKMSHQSVFHNMATENRVLHNDNNVSRDTSFSDMMDDISAEPSLDHTTNVQITSPEVDTIHMLATTNISQKFQSSLLDIISIETVNMNRVNASILSTTRDTHDLMDLTFTGSEETLKDSVILTGPIANITTTKYEATKSAKCWSWSWPLWQSCKNDIESTKTTDSDTTKPTRKQQFIVDTTTNSSEIVHFDTVAEQSSKFPITSPSLAKNYLIQNSSSSSPKYYVKPSSQTRPLSYNISSSKTDIPTIREMPITKQPVTLSGVKSTTISSKSSDLSGFGITVTVEQDSTKVTLKPSPLLLSTNSTDDVSAATLDSVSGNLSRQTTEAGHDIVDILLTSHPPNSRNNSPKSGSTISNLSQSAKASLNYTTMSDTTDETIEKTQDAYKFKTTPMSSSPPSTLRKQKSTTNLSVAIAVTSSSNNNASSMSSSKFSISTRTTYTARKDLARTTIWLIPTKSTKSSLNYTTTFDATDKIIQTRNVDKFETIYPKSPSSPSTLRKQKSTANLSVDIAITSISNNITSTSSEFPITKSATYTAKTDLSRTTLLLNTTKLLPISIVKSETTEVKKQAPTVSVPAAQRPLKVKSSESNCCAVSSTCTALLWALIVVLGLFA
ncbi:serine-rich adhesin for platelets-like [Watersipora subatra]|uniref:serine-rich adhesin for platelets-like n=1 Tax=Watersipora subatra TaxID=2589382 RepID=UPI00355BFB58